MLKATAAMLPVVILQLRLRLLVVAAVGVSGDDVDVLDDVKQKLLLLGSIKAFLSGVESRGASDDVTAVVPAIEPRLT